jgi:ribosomal protein S18 acetylase RimI-like enzyme
LKKTTAKTGRRSAAKPTAGASPRAAAEEAMVIRPVRREDLAQVIAIDATVTGLEKRDYWRTVYGRYGNSGQIERQFLVAAIGPRVVGFVIGEVRDWEFGSPPCGWVFAIDVMPDARQAGIGARLLEAICDVFRRAGVSKVRTMLGRDNTLILSFFRSQGMMAGPFIPLEMDLQTGSGHSPRRNAAR